MAKTKNWKNQYEDEMEVVWNSHFWGVKACDTTQILTDVFIQAWENRKMIKELRDLLINKGIISKKEFVVEDKKYQKALLDEMKAMLKGMSIKVIKDRPKDMI